MTISPTVQPSSRAAKLAAAAQTAAEVRAYQTAPDVVALRVERVRAWVDRLIWTGLVLGLLFTMANVQGFAAQGAATYSTAWWIAWLLDPMVSLVLIGVLMGEQVIARHKIKADPWVRRTKWMALLCTYGMNTWQAWEGHNPANILLHSVPPVMVFCAAEAITTLRHQITEAVDIAYRAAAVRAEAEVSLSVDHDVPTTETTTPASIETTTPAIETTTPATAETTTPATAETTTPATAETTTPAAPETTTESTGLGSARKTTSKTPRATSAPVARTTGRPTSEQNAGAVDRYLTSVAAGSPLSQRELAAEYDRSKGWAHDRIREAIQQAGPQVVGGHRTDRPVDHLEDLADDHLEDHPDDRSFDHGDQAVVGVGS